MVSHTKSSLLLARRIKERRSSYCPLTDWKQQHTTPANSRQTPPGQWGRTAWAQHCLPASTAPLTFPSLQPGRIYFYSNRTVTCRVAKLLQAEEPSCWAACWSSSKDALVLAANQIYWHHHSWPPQGPLKLHSHAPVLSTGYTWQFTTCFSHLQSADTSVGWLCYLFNSVFTKTMNFQTPKLHAAFLFSPFVSLGSSKRKIKMCFTLEK